MSWNTWLASMTKMENLSDATLIEMADRLDKMMQHYRGNFEDMGLLGGYSMKEYDKCKVQYDRVSKEIARRGLYGR